MARLIESSRAYGRGLLLGVAKFVREHGRWSVFLQERSLGDVSPSWLKGWEGNGIIARVENRPMAEAIRRLGLPAVDVRYLRPKLEMPSIRTDDEAVARVAAEHLLERGFRYFAFCGFDGADYSDIRRDSFAEETTVSPRLLPADAKLDRWAHLWTPTDWPASIDALKRLDC